MTLAARHRPYSRRDTPTRSGCPQERSAKSGFDLVGGGVPGGAQAVSCAQRSSSWAGSDNTLRFENWQIIAKARGALGDTEGAKEAFDAAERLK